MCCFLSRSTAGGCSWPAVPSTRPRPRRNLSWEEEGHAHAERWVGTIRRECLDWVLIRGEDHLEQVLAEFVTHYNTARPHRGLQLRPPANNAVGQLPIGKVMRRDRLGTMRLTRPPEIGQNG